MLRNWKRVFSLLVFGACLLFVSTDCLADVKDRLIRVSRSSIWDPLHFAYVRVGGVEVKPGVAFRADSDWLERTQIVLSNDSHKQIVAVRFFLTFPELGSGQPGDPLVGATIQIGRMPESALYTRDGGKRVDGTAAMPALAPARGLIIDLANYRDALTEPIKRHIGTTEPSTLMIDLSVVYFADGSKWESGVYSRPSETEKGRYVRITKDEFDQLTSGDTK